MADELLNRKILGKIAKEVKDAEKFVRKIAIMAFAIVETYREDVKKGKLDAPPSDGPNAPDIGDLSILASNETGEQKLMIYYHPGKTFVESQKTKGGPALVFSVAWRGPDIAKATFDKYDPDGPWKKAAQTLWLEWRRVLKQKREEKIHRDTVARERQEALERQAELLETARRFGIQKK